MYSSERLLFQIIGAFLKWNLLFWIFIILLIGLVSYPFYQYITPNESWRYWWFAGSNVAAFIIIVICYQLNDVFSLRQKDSRITGSYVIIMFTLVLWVMAFLLIFTVNKAGDKENVKVTAIAGASGVLITWVFKDKIEGVATYIHLRTHNLLNIDDWIKIPAINVDGVVTKITLTSVTICNWDTTTSIVPINKLSTNNFINLQNMMQGKTYGRQMLKTFVLDTSWFHTLTDTEITQLLAKGDVNKYLTIEEIDGKTGNAHLFRLYLYNWLTQHSHISLYPRLVVRWLEQMQNGMPLQIYAFITDSNLLSFETQQSAIIEHVIESLGWFGLRLFQQPSSYDVSNNNIFMSETPANYRL